MPQNQNMVILMQEASHFFLSYMRIRRLRPVCSYMKHIWLINTLLYKGQQVIPLLISGCSVYVETFNLLVQGHANSSDVILIGTCNTLHSVIFNLGTLHVTWNLQLLTLAFDGTIFQPYWRHVEPADAASITALGLEISSLTLFVEEARFINCRL